MKKVNLYKMLLSAMFLALGVALPFFTSQIKEIGDTLLPMHLPVMLCGLFCGHWYGLVVGFITPLLRSVLFGMPPIYPNGVWMAFELAIYGFVIGFLYLKFKNKSLKNLYISLISAQLSGRIVWGIVKAVLLSAGSKPFTVAMFVTGGFIDALPGIILQLILIPVVVKLSERFILPRLTRVEPVTPDK